MFEMVTKENRKNKNTPILPQRATTHSAGYDFFCPTQLVIPPHSTKLIWTDIKIELNPNEFLLMFLAHQWQSKNQYNSQTRQA